MLMVPSIEDAYAKAVYTALGGWPLIVASSAITVRHFAYCFGDYLGCIKQEFADDLVHVYTWENGIGKMVGWSPSFLWRGHRVLPVFFSHAAYRNFTHDPKAGRSPDCFVFVCKPDVPEGVLPEEEHNILLNLDTGSPEHTARRQLIADTLPALAQTAPTRKAVKVPTTSPSAYRVLFMKEEGPLRHRLKRVVFDIVGYNVFLELFGVDIQDLLEDHYEYDKIFAPGVIGAPVMKWQGKRLAAIRRKIQAKVEAGPVAKRFQEVARERGMDPVKRLSEVVWIAMFAGYGGTGNLAFETLKMILTDSERFVPLFRRDPRAFMLEAARLHPPVGGMNPSAIRVARKHVLATGETLEMKPGDVAMTLSSGANVDPQVFEDPREFKPGRANAARLLSWNNEPAEFATCESVAGCPAAPRACPGTWLSLRIATATVDLFVQFLEDRHDVGENATATRAEEL